MSVVLAEHLDHAQFVVEVLRHLQSFVLAEHLDHAQLVVEVLRHLHCLPAAVLS